MFCGIKQNLKELMLAQAKLSYSTDADKLLQNILRTGVVSLDTETTHLDPYQGQIGIVILESGGETFILRKLPAWFEDVFADPDTRKILFNAKFDLSWIIHHYGWRKYRHIADCYLNELLISTQRRSVKHTLQAVLKRRLGVEISKGEEEGEKKELPFAARVDWTGALTDEMVEYACADIIYLRPLDEYLSRQIAETKQGRASQIENDIVSAVAEMGLNGIGIDRPTWETAIEDWLAQADHAHHRLAEVLPQQPNWNSPKQVTAVLKDAYGIELPNTRHATLETFQEEMPALQFLLEYRHWIKRTQNWGWDFLQQMVNPVTGRVLPSWWQLGTETGRFSCSKPNMQQIPRDKATRALFAAKEGHLIASIDYKAIEMLVAAVIAKDEEFLRVCQEEDPHTQVAQLVLGAGSTVTSEERQLAKAVGFGLLFGGGVDGFMAYARNNYKVEIARDRAEVVVKSFFDRFPGLKAKRAQAYSFFRGPDGEARSPGVLEVRTLTGLRRLLQGDSCKPTTWLNTQIQGSAGYGIKCGLKRLADAGLSQYLCLQVHDELVLEFPKEQADELAERATSCMVRGMQDVLGPVKVGVDVVIGERWQ
jgi:DNA polymerase-1